MTGPSYIPSNKAVALVIRSVVVALLSACFTPGGSVWELLPSLREEHGPQLVVSLDPLQPVLSVLHSVGVSPTPDNIRGIGVVVLVYAHEVLVDLVRFAWLASLAHSTRRRGQIEGHHRLLGDVYGNVPSVPVDMYDVLYHIWVRCQCAFEVCVPEVLSHLYNSWALYLYTLDIGFKWCVVWL